MSQKSAFTLMELVFAIIIISLSFLAVALMYNQVLRGAFEASVFSKAALLAEGKMEEVLIKGYHGVTDTPLTNFPSPFSDYSFEVEADDVEAQDLDHPVNDDHLQYKRVELKVSHSGIADIELVSLLSDYTHDDD